MIETTEEHYRELVLQAALFKKDVCASMKRLQQQAQALEHDARLLRNQIDMLMTYVSG